MPNNKVPKHLKKELKLLLKQFPPQELSKRIRHVIQSYEDHTISTRLKIYHLQTLQSLLCLFSLGKKKYNKH